MVWMMLKAGYSERRIRNVMGATSFVC